MEIVTTDYETKPHAVFVPFPAQGHIKCMLKLARLLHHKGLHITFVNTEFNHKRFLKSGGPHSLDGAPGFRFATIPDGVVSSKREDATQDLGELSASIRINCLAPFLELLARLDPPVSCIISDGFMPFTIVAAEKLGVPLMHFWTLAACAFFGFYHGPTLVEKGLIPLKDASCFTNGYLNTAVDSIPGLEGFRLKDLPTYVRTTNLRNIDYELECVMATRKVSHVILHTFEELESARIKVLQQMFPSVYTVGPLQSLLNNIANEEGTKKMDAIGYSLWKEEPECIQWLKSKEANSVVYVNFGSITVMSSKELMEFGWGLANSNHHFLWIIRPDLVVGESSVLPLEFKEAIKDRGFIASWCSQEEVLNHPSVGGFLTHCGWGSVIESLSAGVPMICWPFFGDQPTNCKPVCEEWGVGMQIGNPVGRDEVEKLVRELMGGIEGDRMRKKAMEWKKIIGITTGPNGSASLKVDKLAKDIASFAKK